ncbi:hypothetical protein RND81_01G201600 [Saponaria officinalis]|uniref:Cytochrome P450 n=1 Tax=Saponaria officinalis TaxID=3572 RepID=A0AAW1N8S3_SAPOF
MNYLTPMNSYTIILSLVVILATTFLLNLYKNHGRPKLPPGPNPWPIIGNIHKLGNRPHRSVAELVKSYGPIMSLKLGTITTIVISSSDLTRKMFLNHDLALSSRTFPDAFRERNHDKLSMIWLPVGPKWRNLRKIVTVQLFTNQRLDASQILRQNKVKELVDHVMSCVRKGAGVDIGKAGFVTSLNLLSNTCFSIDLAGYDSSYSHEFKGIVWNILEDGGKPNISDFFPIIRKFDFQGIRKRNRGHFLKMLGLFEEIINKRLTDENGGKNDMLDTLLELVKNKELSLEEVKHMLLDLFAAGTDTTSSTLEWAMTELLRNPDKLIKAQIETDQLNLNKNSPIQENDISKLPYIQAVIKETLRLHPPAPFLVPHKAETEVELSGYLIPKNAGIWVNVWSIGRDPNEWPDALSFLPERFLGNGIDIKGRDFKLIPFGAGRRMCPGMPLAYRMVHLMLANLVHSFDWKHDNGVKCEDIDLEEKFGITLQKVQPLLAIPFVRR